MLQKIFDRFSKSFSVIMYIEDFFLSKKLIQQKLLNKITFKQTLYELFKSIIGLCTSQKGFLYG